ncbi:RNA-directed DNA polymerase, eukaryota, reverse transcriptase zinc-binding domain protein [Tanacetum coccineum]
MTSLRQNARSLWANRSDEAKRNQEHPFSKDKKDLWKTLKVYKQLIKGKTWILMGDWNVSLNVSDHPEGGSCKTADMLYFQECLEEIKVEDINRNCLHFTWIQSTLDPGNGILKKIDRVLGNSEFMGDFPIAYATFLPHLTFDHCRAITEEWKSKLKSIQTKVDVEPHNVDLRKEEASILKEYYDDVSDEENLLFQQAKIEWLKDGDRNSKFFHAFLKCRRNKATQIDLLDKIHFDKTVSQSEADWMTRQVTDEEIKQALFDIYDNKAPDGFSSRFYKKAWEIIGKDVCAFVKEFFKKGRMLGEVNATLISLIPKLDTPTKVLEFRPIACCNTLYKCISKNLTERIKKALCYLVDPNQSALCRLLTTSC